VKKLIVPEKDPLLTRNVAWDGTVIKMERDEIEPTPEELERSYRELFQVRDWRNDRPSYPRSQPGRWIVSLWKAEISFLQVIVKTLYLEKKKRRKYCV